LPVRRRRAFRRRQGYGEQDGGQPKYPNYTKKAIALTEFTEWTWQTEVRSQKPEFFAGRLYPDLGPWTWNFGHLTPLAGLTLPRRPNFNPKPSLSAILSAVALAEAEAFLPAISSAAALAKVEVSTTAGATAEG
jgi:hypothetical protein